MEVEIGEHNVMIEGQNLFDQPVKNDLRIYYFEKLLQNWFLLNYPYFKENYKLITIDLNKHHVLNADAKAIQ